MQSSTKVRNAAHSHGARGATSGNIGSWKLEEWIGEGCWTRVYRARPNDACDHADYALKILKPEYRNDMLAVQMLQRSIEKEPGIVRTTPVQDMIRCYGLLDRQAQLLTEAAKSSNEPVEKAFRQARDKSWVGIKAVLGIEE